VSGEDKCRHPPSGHGRYTRVAIKNLPKLTPPTVPSPTNNNKQLMAIVTGLKFNKKNFKKPRTMLLII